MAAFEPKAVMAAVTAQVTTGRGLPEALAPTVASFAVDPTAIDGAWTRSLRAEDIATEQGPLAWMAYSPALDCLLAGNDGHNNTYAIDVATLKLRDVPGLRTITTPFPGGGIAVGAPPERPPSAEADGAAAAAAEAAEPSAKRAKAGAHERVFVTERRYDHINVADLVDGEGGRLELVRRDPIGDEGDEYMLAPCTLALDTAADELWVARGAYGEPPMFVSVARASAREKLGTIPASALGGDAACVAAIALSDDEAFVAVGAALKVFARSDREAVELVDIDQTLTAELEVARGYALKRELELGEHARDVVWSHGKLVVCTPSGVRVLAPDGRELRCWCTTSCAAGADGPRPFVPKCAVVCGRRGERPQELAVLDTTGSIHFYT